MSSFAPSVLDNLRLTHEIVTAIRAIGEGKGKQDLFKERAPEVLENLRQVAIIESTESSNRLEGITALRTAIELLVRRNTEPRTGNRSEAETAGYRDVLQLIHERYEYMELTPNLVLQLHRDLFKYSGSGGAGRWKIADNLITEKRPDGTPFVRFTPTPAWRTADAMELPSGRSRTTIEENGQEAAGARRVAARIKTGQPLTAIVRGRVCMRWCQPRHGV